MSSSSHYDVWEKIDAKTSLRYIATDEGCQFAGPAQGLYIPHGLSTYCQHCDANNNNIDFAQQLFNNFAICFLLSFVFHRLDINIFKFILNDTVKKLDWFNYRGKPKQS